MAMTPPDDQLPCGTQLDQLVMQVTEDTPASDPAHQARCPYCQTALSALARSWNDVQTLAREPVPLPPGLTARIMTRVRSLAARAATTFFLGTEHGQTGVSHRVIAQIAARAALAVPGVVFASAQTRPTQDANQLTLVMRVVIAFGPAADALADAARALIQRRVPRLTGAAITTIDIRIDDIATPQPDSHRATR